MKDTIFLPKTIKVGFQTCSDTYTKKLAYVIYTDEKGVLRKEKSWESWRSKNIEPEEYKNEPISGFVLNKKVGGDRYGWNPRQTYTRIFDPRGFEFEITVPNLLYILENTSSIKGKGLEGNFVYGWSGTELVLIPEGAPEYSKLKEYSEMVESAEKLKGKDLILGGTYRTKQNKYLVYLGRFDYHEFSYGTQSYKNKGKRYFFRLLGSKTDNLSMAGSFVYLSNLNKIIKTVDKTPHPEYADFMDKLESHDAYSPVDSSKDEYLDMSFEEFCKSEYSHTHNKTVFFKYNGIHIKGTVRDYYYNGTYYLASFNRVTPLPGKNIYYYEYEDEEFNIIRKELKNLGVTSTEKKQTLKELYNKLNFKRRVQYLENGKEYKQ